MATTSSDQILDLTPKTDSEVLENDDTCSENTEEEVDEQEEEEESEEEFRARKARESSERWAQLIANAEAEFELDEGPLDVAIKDLKWVVNDYILV